MTRRQRIAFAILTITALLFSQGAVAAHACAVLLAPPAMEMPCEHEGAAKPNLCVSHCDFGNASVDTAKAAFSAPLMVDAGLRVPSLEAMHAPRHARLQRVESAEPEPPPTRFTVLRI